MFNITDQENVEWHKKAIETAGIIIRENLQMERASEISLDQLWKEIDADFQNNEPTKCLYPIQFSMMSHPSGGVVVLCTAVLDGDVLSFTTEPIFNRESGVKNDL